MSGVCLFCTNLIGNCLNCSLNLLDSAVCITCNQGFYLSNYYCLSCPNTCLTCSNSSSCISCIDGLYLSGSNECLPCPIVNCASCNPSNLSNCDVCYSGYYYYQNQCAPCGYGCLNCTQFGCLECLSSFT